MKEMVERLNRKRKGGAVVAAGAERRDEGESVHSQQPTEPDRSCVSVTLLDFVLLVF